MFLYITLYTRFPRNPLDYLTTHRNFLYKISSITFAESQPHIERKEKKKITHILVLTKNLSSRLQRWRTATGVQRPARLAAPRAASPGTPTRTTAGSTTSAWRASPVSTAAPSAPSSRSATPTAAAPARTPRTFPDGEFVAQTLPRPLFRLSPLLDACRRVDLGTCFPEQEIQMWA